MGRGDEGGKQAAGRVGAGLKRDGESKIWAKRGALRYFKGLGTKEGVKGTLMPPRTREALLLTQQGFR